MQRKILADKCDRCVEVCLWLIWVAIPFSRALVETGIVLALVAWMIKRITIREFKFVRTYLNVPLFAYIFIGVISFVYTDYLFLSIKGFIKVVKYALLFWLVVETMADKQKFKRLLVVTIISSAVIGFDGLIQWFIGRDIIRQHGLYGNRITASLSDPNSFGGWLIVVIPVYISLFFSGWQCRYRWKWMVGFLIFLLITCLLLTHSQGAWFGFTIGMIAMVFLQYMNVRLGRMTKRNLSFLRNKELSIFILISMLALIFLLLGPGIDRLKDVFCLARGSGLIRIGLWQTAMRMIEISPLFGHGVNAFYPNFQKYNMGGGVEAGYAHNGYLQMAAEMGIFGLTLFIWMMVTLFSMTYTLMKTAKDRFYLAALQGLLAGLVCFLVHNFMDTNFYSIPLATLFWFTTGLVVSLQKLSQINDIVQT